MTKPGALTFILLRDADTALVDELNARDEVKRYMGAITHTPHLRARIHVVEEDGVPVGIVGLVKSTGLLGSPEGYHLVCALIEAAQGRHLGTIACKTILDLESTTPPHGVFACIDPANARAEALARNLGFAPTDRTTEKQQMVWFRSMTRT
jgi:RimJ/RimL family protein N-acetyltransferase